MLFDQFIEEFSELEPKERLELLVELSDELPPLQAARQQVPFPPSCRVQECQTAVHLWVDVDEGRVAIEADVPRNSPTVRGLVTLVVQSVQGQPVDEVARIPDDLLHQLGLDEVLGMTRTRGFRGVIDRIRSRALHGGDSPEVA